VAQGTITRHKLADQGHPVNDFLRPGLHCHGSYDQECIFIGLALLFGVQCSVEETSRNEMDTNENYTLSINEGVEILYGRV